MPPTQGERVWEWWNAKPESDSGSNDTRFEGRKGPFRSLERMEARVGIEPTHKGFADLSLTTWVPRLKSEKRNSPPPQRGNVRPIKMERETGFEPATSTLARSHSTAELLPLNRLTDYIQRAPQRQCYPGQWPVHCGSSSGATISPSRIWIMRFP